MSDRQKTFKRGNLTVVLDKDKVIPADPGADTPAMVFWDGADGHFSATFPCAIGEAELDGRNGMKQLTESQMEWLESLETQVDEFLGW